MNPDATYRVETTDDALKGVEEISGLDLLHRGLQLSLRGDYDSAVIVFERLPSAHQRQVFLRRIRRLFPLW